MKYPYEARIEIEEDKSKSIVDGIMQILFSLQGIEDPYKTEMSASDRLSFEDEKYIVEFQSFNDLNKLHNKWWRVNLSKKKDAYNIKISKDISEDVYDFLGNPMSHAYTAYNLSISSSNENLVFFIRNIHPEDLIEFLKSIKEIIKNVIIHAVNDNPVEEANKARYEKVKNNLNELL